MPQERIGDRVEIDDDDAPVEIKKPAAAKPEADDDRRLPAPKKGVAEEDGSDFVEIEDPKVLARFKRLYRHVKESDERSEKATRQMALLADQNRKLAKAIDALTTGQKDKQTRDELTRLREEANQALATGDTKAFTEVNERLTEIKIEAKEAKVEEKAEEAPQEDLVTQTELRILGRWQQERDEDGKVLRPWASPTHREFPAVQELIRKVSARQDMEGATVREILAEVDKRMDRLQEDDDEPRRRSKDDEDDTPVRRAFSAPRNQNGGGRRDTSKDTLTAYERTIAEAMFTGGPHAVAKNTKEAHELYLKQKRAIGRVVVVED